MKSIIKYTTIVILGMLIPVKSHSRSQSANPGDLIETLGQGAATRCNKAPLAEKSLSDSTKVSGILRK